MAKQIKAVEENCIGCRSCELACSFNLEEVFNPKRSRIRIHSEHGGIDRPIVCRQCEHADCAEACPTDAIQRDDATGIWEIDREACIGCAACVDACPYDSIFMEPEGEKAIKCEVCNEKSCIEYCPNEALVLQD